MVNKVLETKTEYETTLAEIDSILEIDPEVGTLESDRLELLLLLVEQYESDRYKFDLPDPIEAIRFRMEQQGLIQRDLIPYIGSRSKVSEVLNRRRPLTLPMIRALHSGLGIPAKVLVQDVGLDEAGGIVWTRFPIREAAKRGWVKASRDEIKNHPQEVVNRFLAPLPQPLPAVEAVLYRRSMHMRSERTMDEYALAMWTIRILQLAKLDPPTQQYVPGTVTLEFMTDIVRLSPNKEAPVLAEQFLKEAGISLVIEPHLPRTYLDGTAILSDSLGWPVIGLTLRYDRIDNFWFSLMHELAHIALHLEDNAQFFDDLDLLDFTEPENPIEYEADKLARESMIPTEAWKGSAASMLRSPDAANALATQLEIHPAIVAGRMRYEFKAYRLLSSLVGHREVRKLFPEANWR